jgi:hypothetical protein
MCCRRSTPGPGHPELAATHRHVHDFAEIMTNREGHRLPAWMTEFDQHEKTDAAIVRHRVAQRSRRVPNGFALP